MVPQATKRREDKVRWLDEILQQEKFIAPVIIGQSMGGYVGQMFAQLFPEKLKGFVSIDSAPLQREYVTAAEIWLLKRMEPVYRYYPWKSLLKTGTNGVATSEYGRKLMRDMMMVYDGDQERYASLRAWVSNACRGNGSRSPVRNKMSGTAYLRRKRSCGILHPL